MKKLTFILLLALASCHTTKFTMGMPVNEFTSLNRNAVLLQATADGSSVYKCNTHNNSINKTMFYYFTDGKLVQVDEGVRRADFIIEHTSRNQ